MKRKRRRITYRKERVILSDVLPYELPLTFSNHHFYEFLLTNKVEYHEGTISWKKDDSALDTIIQLLFGVPRGATIYTQKKRVFGELVWMNSLSLNDKAFVTIPFGYKIRHKENEFRELSVCHPRNQVQLVDFYDSNKELILYYCSVSPFSIRRPSRISRFVFHTDRAHYGSLSGETVGVEEYDREYENLRSFFVYKDYSFIFKFYESAAFHRCEKKYNKLLRLDISKCFDSIYTHSLAWALLSKASVKENLNPSRFTFAGQFDRLMQNMNYNETNGIIIGPEFSRIFAELVLQSVDRTVFLELGRDSSAPQGPRTYEIFRYVDDYFVFYNDERTREDILRILQLALKDYKLYLNSGKAANYEKPIITNISIAKQRIETLLNGELAYKMAMVESVSVTATGEARKLRTKTGSIQISAKGLITQFKTIIKESAVEYKDTLNYALAIVEGRSVQIIKDYFSIPKLDRSQKALVQAILNICEFTFFIYSVSPRANTTIRLCRVLQVFTSFLKLEGINRNLKHNVFKVIFDNICLILDKDKNSEVTPVETLYLLVGLSELGKDYWLDVEMLASYMGIKKNASGSFQPLSQLNYISIVVLLFYMKNKRRYDALRNSIEETIKNKFEKKKTTLLKETELTLLLLDTLSCPYVRLETKRDLLKICRIEGAARQTAIIKKQQYWFTKWTDFDFAKELDAKRSQEVY
jgi:hypothetical protein